MSDYSYDDRNADAIASLDDSIGPLNASIAFNSTLAALMVINFVVSGFTLGKPLRQKQVEAHEH